MKKLAMILTAVVVLGLGSAKAQYNRHYFAWASRNYLASDNYKEAIDILNVLLRTNRDSYEGFYLRGYAKWQLDDLLGAEQDFSQAIAINPVYTEAYHFRGIVRAEMGNYDDALGDFGESLALRPDRPDSYYSRGVTHLRNKQYVKAVVDFDMVIRFTDKNAQTYINKGVAMLGLKDTLAAYDNFDKAIRTNREYTEGYNQRAMLLMEQRRFKEALADYDMAVKCDSTYLQPLFNRALIHNYLDNTAASLADFDRVLEIDPYQSGAYFDRALIYAQNGDYKKAIENYDKVVENSPENVKGYYNRASAYLMLGRNADALRDYTKAIELYPDFANAYLNRALVKDRLHDNKGADRDRAIANRKIAEYRARLSRNPEELSIYADTSRRFNQLVSFESRLASKRLQDQESQNISLRPLYRFTLMDARKLAPDPTRLYYAERLAAFQNEIDDSGIVLSNAATNIAPDSLLVIDRRYELGADNWLGLFKRGVSQLAVRQYTSALNILSSAIELNPTNPFIYLNRATTRAEMIDFISSVSRAGRISIENDADMRNTTKRTYNYDEAIADLNKAAKLYPELAYIYYNRAGLYALAGQMPEAFDDYTKAIELNPEFADAYFNRGLVQIYMKDTRKGCFDLSKAGELGIKEAYTVIKRYATTEE